MAPQVLSGEPEEVPAAHRGESAAAGQNGLVSLERLGRREPTMQDHVASVAQRELVNVRSEQFGVVFGVMIQDASVWPQASHLIGRGRPASYWRWSQGKDFWRWA